MKKDHARSEAPAGAARAVRTARELASLAFKVVPAYARGNAQIEGYVKVARDPRDGAMVAPERSKDPLARMPLGTLEPLASALGSGFDVGALVTGSLASESLEIDFACLENRRPTKTKTDPKGATPGRGGILAVLGIDEDGAPVERSGPAQPDARTATEIARALDRLRRDVVSGSFSAHLTFERGGAIVRAVPRATVVVVVEAGVDLHRLASLVPDPRSYQRKGSGDDERSASMPPGSNGAAAHAAKPYAAASHAMNGATSGGAVAPVSSASFRSGPTRTAPYATSPGSPRKRGLLGGALFSLGDRTVRRILGETKAPRPPAARSPAVSASPVRAAGATSPARPPVAAVPPPAPPIVRAEVEETSTRLLRAAEDYLGPRTLDRIIKEAAPRAFAWQNRRVVVSGAERVAPTAANDVYREIRDLFGRGAAVSDALGRFDYEAWLVAQRLATPHAGIARAALTGERAA